ncbi:MAG TPA: site-specific integrase [Gaiellales bacterium]|jgi:integrase|nr:site-specific integrase [Gaiellales bacterium]
MPRPRGSIKQNQQGKWIVRYWTADGRHPSKTFERKTEAERFLKAAVQQTAQNGAPAHRVTLQQVIDEWWQIAEGSVKPRTAERYLNHVRIIERHLGQVSLVALDYDRVQGFVLDLQREYAPKTVTHCYGVLALVLKHAGRRGMLQRPVPKPILPRVSKPKLSVPTLAQVEALAEASQAWLHAAVILAGYCGLRQGELLALHQADVNLAEGWVFVHQARNKTSGALESTKTEQVRRVYLPAAVTTILAEHVDEYPAERVFPVTASVFDKSWRRARAAAELPGVRFHDLRHSAASMMIAAGATVLEVCEQLGHANPTQTLDTYGHLWPNSSADLVSRMDAYLAH